MATDMSKVGCDIIRGFGAGHDNLTVKEADILSLDVNDKYDIVFSSGLLEELSHSKSDMVHAIVNMQDLTNDDGRIILKYCLYISTCNPPDLVPEDFVKPLFENDNWNILAFETDEEPRLYKNASGDDSRIRTQTLVADKLNLNPY